MADLSTSANLAKTRNLLASLITFMVIFLMAQDGRQMRSKCKTESQNAVYSQRGRHEVAESSHHLHRKGKCLLFTKKTES